MIASEILSPKAYTWLGPIDEVGRVLVGGEGDLRVWDMFTGSCRLQHVPNFHTWFKHSVTINVSAKAVKKTPEVSKHVILPILM